MQQKSWGNPIAVPGNGGGGGGIDVDGGCVVVEQWGTI